MEAKRGSQGWMQREREREQLARLLIGSSTPPRCRSKALGPEWNFSSWILSPPFFCFLDYTKLSRLLLLLLYFATRGSAIVTKGTRLFFLCSCLIPDSIWIAYVNGRENRNGAMVMRCSSCRCRPLGCGAPVPERAHKAGILFAPG